MAVAAIKAGAEDFIEKPIDDTHKGIGRFIAFKRIDFRDGRRKTGQIECCPANQNASPGRRRRLERGRFEFPEDELIDW